MLSRISIVTARTSAGGAASAEAPGAGADTTAALAGALARQGALPALISADYRHHFSEEGGLRRILA